MPIFVNSIIEMGMRENLDESYDDLIKILREEELIQKRLSKKTKSLEANSKATKHSPNRSNSKKHRHKTSFDPSP